MLHPVSPEPNMDIPFSEISDGIDLVLFIESNVYSRPPPNEYVPLGHFLHPSVFLSKVSPFGHPKSSEREMRIFY